MLYPYHLDGLAGRLGDTSGVRPILRAPRFAHSTVRSDAGGVTLDVGLEGGGVDAVPKEGVSSRAVRAFTSVYGYADHRLRHGLVKRVSGTSLVSMRDLFETVQRQGVSVTTIHTGNVDQLDAVDVDDHVRETMRTSVVEEGRILLVPERSVAIEGTQRFGWWSVEPEGGVVDGERADLAVGFFEASDAPAGFADVEAGETLARVLEVTSKTFSRPTTYETVVCRGLSQLQFVGRALCARSEPRTLPDPDACDASRKSESRSGGIGVVGIGGHTCEQRARDARCGASSAGYLLSGLIGFDSSSASSEDGDVQLGVPGDDRPSKGSALRCSGR